MSNKGFLPVCREDMEKLNIEQLDFVYVVGEAYVDHPSFGHAIISRVLEDAGYSVCIISQPKSDADYKEFGRPRLAFFVNSGNSSRNSTPLCARDISPGFGTAPPPTSDGADMV